MIEPMRIAIVGAGGAFLMLLLAWCLGRWQRGRRRIDELDQATTFLGTHIDTLGRFLEDPAAPEGLKQRLVAFSDAMDREAVVVELAEAIRRAGADTPAPTGEAAALRAALDALQPTRPDLVIVFAAAVTTGAAAAFLRWPASAAMIGQTLLVGLATDPDREAFVATAGARLWQGGWPAAHPATV